MTDDYYDPIDHMHRLHKMEEAWRRLRPLVARHGHDCISPRFNWERVRFAVYRVNGAQRDWFMGVGR